jgi:hypothetical protein
MTAPVATPRAANPRPCRSTSARVSAATTRRASSTTPSLSRTLDRAQPRYPGCPKHGRRSPLAPADPTQSASLFGVDPKGDRRQGTRTTSLPRPRPRATPHQPSDRSGRQARWLGQLAGRSLADRRREKNDGWMSDGPQRFLFALARPPWIRASDTGSSNVSVAAAGSVSAIRGTGQEVSSAACQFTRRTLCAVRLTIWDRDSSRLGISKLELGEAFASWNRIGVWLRRLEGLRGAA